MATGLGAQLLALPGERNPYPGKLGVAVEGALADLHLVEGNPIEPEVAEGINKEKLSCCSQWRMV